MKIFTVNFFYFLLSLLFYFVPISLHSKEFHFDVTSLGQLRENPSDKRETPLNNYLGLKFLPSEKLSSQFNLRIFRDLSQRWDDTDLYQGVIHYQPHEKIALDAGRQFVDQGFFVETIDGVQTAFSGWKYLDLHLFSGVPRHVEWGDFNENDGLLSGLTLQMKNVDRTNVALHAAWRKWDARVLDVEQNDEVFVGGNVSHQFAVSMTPMVYGIVEYDASGKVLNTGTAGLDIYPHRRLALNAEVNYFNISRQTDRQTIQALFTQGRLFGGRFSSTWTLIPKRVDLLLNYSYRNVEAVKNDSSHGHLLEVSLPWTWEALELFVEPLYYFEKSFGGQLNGVRLTLSKKWIERVSVEVAADVTRYQKVTNNDDTAFSSLGWVGVDVLKGLNIAGGVEFNQNNLFDKDVRGSFKVSYRWDQES